MNDAKPQRGFARNIHPRTAEIDVADVEALAGFFVDDEPRVIQVRNLTGREFCIAEVARQRADNINVLLDALAGGVPAEMVTAIKEALHLSDPDADTSPPDYYHRMAVVRIGIVAPEMSEGEIVQLQEHAGVVWLACFRKIMELSGKGGVTSGKSRRSTGSKPS
jgi:hypothetical protein